MAIGDDAVTAGMAIMTGSEAANTIDTEMNKTRDYIAQRTSAITPITKGGTGAATAAAARAALSVPEAAATSAALAGKVSALANPVGLRWDGSRLVARIDTTDVGRLAHMGDFDWVQAGNMTADVYNRTLTGSYRSLYVNTAGLLGWVSSSERFKQDIEPYPADVAALLAMQLVTFRYIADGDDGPIQHGLIAEQLEALGLTWLVEHEPDGTPEGVRYDLLALALVPVVQSLAARLEAIETHLDTLGGM